MKAIIVDDERLALQWLAEMIRKQGSIEVVGCWQNPLDALRMIASAKVDIVFLDIDLPELNGLEVAESIQSISPQTEIVFVTAYNEYAVKAFELNALDYLLKPVHADRLAKTIQRIEQRNRRTMKSEESNERLRIRCFQSLEFEKCGSKNEIIPVQWRTKKAQELFAFLLHHRGSTVRKELLLDMFWPDADWKKAFAQLYTAVYQIRKVLSANGINIEIHNQGDGYQLDVNGAQLDVEEWEQEVREGVSPDKTYAYQRLIELYRGDYLAEYDYLWAEGERERLKTMWFHYTQQALEQLVARGAHIEAADFAHHMQRLHPHREESYFWLMQIYDRFGDWKAVEKHYHRLTAMLSNEYGVEPQPQVVAWYRAWKARLEANT